MAFHPARDESPSFRIQLPLESRLTSAHIPLDLTSTNTAVHQRIDWGRNAHAVAAHPKCSLGFSLGYTVPTHLIQEAINTMIDPHSRLLTPNGSGDEHSTGSGSDEQVVSVSSSFYPGAHETRHDIVFRTTDAVLFYLNSSILRSVSPRAFEAFLPPLVSAHLPPNASGSDDDLVDIPETSTILNVIAHALYDTSCASQAPSLDTIEAAIDRMPFYGITPTLHILPGTALSSLLLSHAPLAALQVYTLAAKHGLHELAVQASAHTLSVSMALVTDEMAERMGSVYLKNLMLLHLGRKETFKTIVLAPPEKHVPSKACSAEDQKKLHRAWALAAAYLVWEGRIDTPIATLQDTFSSLEANVLCDVCKTCLKTRTKDVIVRWAAVKRTI